TALGRGRGENFDVVALRSAIDQRGYIRREDQGKLTAHDVLHRELEVVLAAKQGKAAHDPLVSGYSPSEQLSLEQRKAVDHIFGSRGFITLFRGDRKSTRLNSSHVKISYAVFCLKKKIIITMISF